MRSINDDGSVIFAAVLLHALFHYISVTVSVSQRLSFILPAVYDERYPFLTISKKVN